MMKSTLTTLCQAATLTAPMVSGQVAEEYDVTDITGWSPVQLASLPHFDHYVPVTPVGATGDFQAVAHNGRGLVIGNRTSSTSWVQGSGAHVSGGVSTNIPAWLRAGYSWSFSWSNTYWDGTDYHFSNGFVTHSPARDVNIDGVMIGYATVPGSASQNTSTFPAGAYQDHAWLLDHSAEEKVDLTPNADRADPRMINDLGEIVGKWWNSTESHAFRRASDGTWNDLTLNTGTAYSITPTVINNDGWVAGNATIYTVPDRDYRAFFSESGSSTIPLPLPSQNSPNTGIVNDINDHGIIVGYAYKSASPVEKNGVRWYRESNGTWVAEDLNELITHEDFLIDRCLAVNDAGHIIASGHPDGTDTPNTKRLLLTPDTFPKPAATTLLVKNITPTSATLRARVVACTQSTSISFQHGPTTAYGTTALVPDQVTGTVPALATVELSSLTPHTTYHVRVRAASSAGTTDGNDIEFTTPYDIPTWISDMFGSIASDPESVGLDKDYDHDGETTLEEYAFGHHPTTSDAKGPDPVVDQTDGFCLVFDRPVNHAGLTYEVQVATDLRGPWNSGPGFTEIVSSTLNSNLETVKARSLLPLASHPHQFMRVEVTHSP